MDESLDKLIEGECVEEKVWDEAVPEAPVGAEAEAVDVDVSEAVAALEPEKPDYLFDFRMGLGSRKTVVTTEELSEMRMDVLNVS
jgi:hypothetical protein